MKPLMLIVLLYGARRFAQIPQPRGEADGRPFSRPARKMTSSFPDGKTQRDEIAKADYKKNLEDAAELRQARRGFESGSGKRTSAFVVSVKTMKKTEDIEKLERNIRSRLKRY